MFADRFPGCRSALRSLLNAHEYIEKNAPLLPPPWPEPGERLGDFTIRRELGRGAFARVYLATEATIGNRHVVVKLLQESTAEPHTLGKLNHPGIVPVLSARPEVGADGFAAASACPSWAVPRCTTCSICRLSPSGLEPCSPRWAQVILDAAPTAGQPEDPPLDDTVVDRTLQQGSYVQGVRAPRLHGWPRQLGLRACGQRLVHRDLKPSNVLALSLGGVRRKL